MKHSLVVPVAAALRRVSTTTGLHFRLSSPVFVLCWWGVMLIHIASGSFLLFLALVHGLLGTDAIYPNIYLLYIGQRQLQIAGLIFFVPALVHFVAVFRDVRWSIRCRRLTFASAEKHHARSHQVSPSTAEPNATHARPLATVRARLSEVRNRWRRAADSIRVNGHHFEKFMCANQAVDILSQTYQAYLCSHNVPHNLLTRVLVVLVVINCIYLPVLDVVATKNTAVYLSAALILDLVLDVAVSVIIPLSVILPYFLAFDWKAGKIPDWLRFDNVASLIGLIEVRYVLVTSVLDNISTLIPYLAVHETLRSLKIMLIRVSNIDHVELTDNPPPQPEVSRVAKPRVLRLFYAFSGLVVAFVSITHGEAEWRRHNSPSSTCTLPMKPWFGHNMSCAIFELNCYREGILGQSDEVTNLMAPLDRRLLKRILISHCPSLSIPSSITEYHDVRSIHTVNCTLVDWPMDAALTSTLTPHVAEVELVTTNMTDLPSGILHNQLPIHLNLIVHRSNLTRLPDDVGNLWRDHVWTIFTFAHVPLRTIPASLANTSISYFTLFDNDFDELPEDMFVRDSLSRFRVSQNPRLSRLPANLGTASTVDVVVAENTNVSSSTEWIERWWASRNGTHKTEVMSFYGSPLCDAGGVYADSDHCTPSGLLAREDERYALVQRLRPL